ncbi:DEAD/DEAH box helicase [Planococcus plakortidis]
MELKVYDKQAYASDTVAQNFYTYLENQFQTEESLCLYKEPDYYTNANVLPTFTVLDKKYGVIVFKIYDYTSENLTIMNDRYWEIDGTKNRNDLIHFEDYCYKFQNDINLPTNEIFSEIKFQKIAVFPSLNKDEIRLEIKRQEVKLLFDDYRKFDIKAALQTTQIDEEDWYKLNSIVQKANMLSKDIGFTLEKPLSNLREAIAYNNQKISQFDDTQLDASLTITDNAERIRGLAGTGKTIILAIKAARLHRKNPDAKIVYTFSTHSLYNQVRRLISKYYRKITGNDPNWENLKIIHAWGGKTTGEGFYYNACLNNGITALHYGNLKYEENPFGKACEKLLNHNLKEQYDYVLIDEAQDLPLEFFKLVERITKKPKRIIWAYDELQTTSNIKIPDTIELFGKNDDDTPKVPLKPENDYILKKAYRNHQKVLMMAFALGFGLYSRGGITQIIRDKETWDAIGFKVAGDLIPETHVTIKRPKENNPNNIDEHYPSRDIIQTCIEASKTHEITSVANEIIYLIKEEKVNPQDIMVIDMDTRPKNNLIYLQSILYEKEIESLIPGLIDGAKDFIIEDNVTLTTVRRAKGNEVPIVFVMGAERIYDFKNEYEKRILRNMIFISLTRSKGWLYLSAAGNNARTFMEEVDRAMFDISQGKYYFPFPSEDMLKEIEHLNMLTKDNKKIEKLQDNAELLRKLAEAEDLSELDMFLDEETKRKFIEALTKKKV